MYKIITNTRDDGTFYIIAKDKDKEMYFYLETYGYKNIIENAEILKKRIEESLSKIENNLKQDGFLNRMLVSANI